MPEFTGKGEGGALNNEPDSVGKGEGGTAGAEPEPTGGTEVLVLGAGEALGTAVGAGSP